MENNHGNVKKSAEDLHQVMQTIDRNLASGWFKERALLRLYKTDQNPTDYQNVIALIKNKTWTFIFKASRGGCECHCTSPGRIISYWLATLLS